MAVKLGYAIHFVADMDRAVAFYRDTDSEGARVSLSGQLSGQ